MATVHEVAKAAKVSPATVSKYINKSGYVAPETRERVQAAIEKLDYHMNRAAKYLRTRRSDQVAVLLPDLASKLNSTIFSAISAHLQAAGYRAVIFTTNDSPNTETEQLLYCSQGDFAGIIVCTAQPSNESLFAQIVEKKPIVFLLRMPTLKGVNFLGFEQTEIIFRITDALLAHGTMKIVLYTDREDFSCEKDCINGFMTAFAHNGMRPGRVYSYPFSKTSAYGIIMGLLASENRPDVFITTSKSIAETVSEVIMLNGLTIGKDVSVISLGEESWYDSLFFTSVVSTFRPAYELGEQAGATLVANIASPVVCEKSSRSFKDEFPCERIKGYLESLGKRAVKHAGPAQKTLRLLYPYYEYGCDALRCLAAQYCAQTGVNVEVCGVDYEVMYDRYLRMADGREDSADILAMDLIWLPYFAAKGLLLDLTDVQAPGVPLAYRTVPGFFSLASTYRSRVYGYPMSYATELLFYRKDLFANAALQEDFYDHYQIPLEPPKDWFTFNLIARYFTREFTPGSPTKYGTSAQTHPCVCAGIYSRIWAAGGNVHDSEGNVTLYSDETVRAYANYVEMLSYTSADLVSASPRFSEMMNGDAAMIATFCSDAPLMFSRTYSRYAESVGFAPLPSKISVASAWVLGVNRYGRNARAAIDFLNWFSQDEASMAYTVLGGMAPWKNIYKYPEIRRSSPWMDMAFKAFPNCRARNCAVRNDAPPVDPMSVERIIKLPVIRYMREGGSIDEYVRDAHMQLRSLFERGGIPQKEPFFR